MPNEVFDPHVEKMAKYYGQLMKEGSTHITALKLALERMYTAAYREGYNDGEENERMSDEIEQAKAF